MFAALPVPERGPGATTAPTIARAAPLPTMTDAGRGPSVATRDATIALLVRPS